MPAQPSARNKQFGVFHWSAADFNAYNTNRQVNGVQTDRLNWMAEQVAQMGTTSIKVYLGTGDYYDFNSDGRSFPQLLPYTLKQLVTTLQDAETGAHPYDKLFKDPRFETYFLSVYSIGGAQNNWVDGYDCQEYLTERDEIRELGEYLLGNPAYEGKTFILTNWEGDCAFIETPGLRPRWNDFRNYIQAKSDGVRLARASGLINGDFQPGKARLYSAMEYKLTYAIVPGASSYTPYRNDGARVRCGTPGNDNYRCLVDTVAPFVNVDYYSYSAYESTNILYPTLDFASCENPESDLKKELRDNLSFSLCVIKSIRGNIEAKNFIIGEYNWGVEGIGGDEPSFLNQMFRAIEDTDGFPLSYTFFYQALCISNIGQLFTASNNKIRTPTGRIFAPWKSLGGIITTSPAVASWERDRLDVFVRGIDSYLYHNFSTDGGRTWAGWGGDYESSITSDPAAISPEKGRIDLFVRGPNDDLLYKRYTSAGWSNWISLGGMITSGPAVASWEPNRLDVFARGTDSYLYHNFSTDGGLTWAGWGGDYASTVTSDPAAVSWGVGRIDLFARGPNNDLLHKSYSGAGWSNYESLGGKLTSGPSVTSQGPGRLDVFIRGLNEGLWQNTYDGLTWNGWQLRAGRFAQKPAAISRAPGKIDVFAKGIDNTAWHRWYDQNSSVPDSWLP
ncbi:MAG: exo-alpha-sialidase [Acidobacteria bacterium]|nr:exo-alpha-sialidase [Acidobacteriota bacterium]